MKKKIIVIAVIVVFVIAAILTTCIVMFLPKKLSDCIDTDDIISVQLYKGEELYKQLSADEIGGFTGIVDATTYKARYTDIKAATIERIVITYSDGSVTEFNGYLIKKTDGNGETTGKKVYINMTEIYKNF